MGNFQIVFVFILWQLCSAPDPMRMNKNVSSKRASRAPDSRTEDAIRTYEYLSKFDKYLDGLKQYPQTYINYYPFSLSDYQYPREYNRPLPYAIPYYQSYADKYLFKSSESLPNLAAPQVPYEPLQPEYEIVHYDPKLYSAEAPTYTPYYHQKPIKYRYFTKASMNQTTKNSSKSKVSEEGTDDPKVAMVFDIMQASPSLAKEVMNCLLNNSHFQQVMDQIKA